jgi:hypothetical protein
MVMAAALRKFLFIIALTFPLANHAFTQPSILKKKISVSFDNISVEKLLIYLSNEAGFNFTYNSDIIKVNNPVSFHGQNVMIEDVLKAILPADIRYSTSGDYLILVKEHSNETKSARNARYGIKGYTYNDVSGKAIANVSVFDATGFESVLSDSAGFYDLKVTSRYEQINLHYSKKNFLDTLIIVQPSDRSLNIALRPEPVKKSTNLPESLESIKPMPVENLEFVRKIVSRDQIVQSENIRVIKTRLAQISLWPKVGTNLKMSGFVDNNVSLNVFAGYAHGLNGVEIGGLANIDRNTVRGLQAAGIANIVGGSVSGVQVGGLINTNRSGLNGVQLAGINNILQNDIHGAQISGVNNVLRGSMTGIQLAGISNYISENVKGIQIAGISNISGKDVNLMQAGGLLNVGSHIGGVQLAGLINIAKKSVGGVQVVGLINTTIDTVKGIQLAGLINYAGTVNTGQFAGIVNIAGKNVNGVQLSGGVNYSRNVKGVQIGLINIADTVGGIPIGLISFVHRGYYKLEISVEEVFFTNLTWKMGVHHFYNIFSTGIRPSGGNIIGNPLWGVGYGIGTQIGKGKITVNLDLKSSWHVEDINTRNYFFSYRFNPQLTYNILPHFGVFAGPALTLFTSDCNNQETQNTIMQVTLQDSSLWEKSSIHNVLYQLWAGGSIGLRFF